MEKITIQIVEDHELVGDALKTRLEKERNFKVVAISHSEDEAVEDAFFFKPNIILMDINLKQGNGLSATSRILKRLKKSSKVIGLSVRLDLAHIKRILKLGAKGYVTKGSPIEELIDAITIVHRENKRFLCNEVKNQFELIEDEDIDKRLSDREIEIISLLIMHKTQGEIADFLKLSKRTVQTHVYNARKKLNAKRTSDLIHIAIEQGYQF